ncbi:MAG: DUF6174 domain-containing protein [Spirochaetota bacterium]|nr:DUF6174 domain-containing protein [Spirochaetota bacterium]
MKKILLAACIAVVLISCSDRTYVVTPSFDRDTFDRERQLWLIQDIQNYSFQQEYQLSNISCALTTLFVENGVAQRYRQDDYSDELYALDNVGPTHYTFFKAGLLLLTISDLYAEIERFANRNLYRIDIRYSNLHYPTYVEMEHSGVQMEYGGDNTCTIWFIRNFIIDPED